MATQVAEYRLTDRFGQVGGSIIDHDQETPAAIVKELLDRYGKRLRYVRLAGVVIYAQEPKQ